MGFTSETAKAAQQKSAEVRKRRKTMTPAERVREIAAADADTAIRDLIKGAKGAAPYDSLTPKERLDAWKTVLAYGVGRPTASPAKEAPPQEEEAVEEQPSLV